VLRRNQNLGNEEPDGAKKRPRKSLKAFARVALAIALPTVIFAGLGVKSGIDAAAYETPLIPDLTVSANHRYFVDAAGDPFFWMADTAWSMPINLTREEVDEYLDKRVAQGFTVIQTVAIFNQAGGPGPNRYGDWPYGPSGLSEPLVTDGADPRDPQQYDYWDHLDFIISEANARGLRVALVPVWADRQVGSLLTKSNAQAFGTFIGARFHDRRVIWVLGGDHSAEGEQAIWRNLARGIAIGATRTENYNIFLMTYHPYADDSSSTYFGDDRWLSFDMLQGGHCLRYDKRRDLIAATYNSSPTRPFLDGEPLYAAHPYCWDDPPDGYSESIDVRRDEYWAAFSGAAGVTYGDHTVWQFLGATDHPAAMGAVGNWREAMDDEAAWQMQYLVKLMDSHPWWKGVPDNDILTDQPRDGAAQLQAIVASDKSYAMVYSPDGQPFDADIASPIGDSTRMSWYDPRTGESIDLGMVAEASQTYNPPTAEDWVLVADAVKDGAPSPP
jgi:Protein of unknown function (DUF4038)/Putative collagen-binding domain of a collagenase